MKERLEHILQKMRLLSLTFDEKAQMRERLREYMQYRPVRSPEVDRPHLQEESIPLTVETTKRRFPFRPMITVTAGILIAILAGGGVSFAAEGSVPGDVLYPVKTAVNEEVVSLAYLSEEADAKWEARRAERRIEEAEQLAVENRINQETRMQLEAQALAHLEEAKTIAADADADVQADVQAEVQSRVESSLGAHERVMEQLQAAEQVSAEARAELGAMLETLRERRVEAREERTRAEARISAQAGIVTEEAARGKLTAAENAADAAVRAYERVRADLSASAREDIEAEISAMNEALTESEASVETGAYAASFTQSQAVMRQATRIQVLSNTHARLRIDIAIPAVEVDVGGGATSTQATSTSATSTESENVDGEVGEEQGDTEEGAGGTTTTIDAEVDTGAGLDLQGGVDVDVNTNVGN